MADYCVARIETAPAPKSGGGAADAMRKHIERENKNYDNLNVEPERSYLNVRFKDAEGRSYYEILAEMERNGVVTRRGLRADAKVFNEMVIDVNSEFFENHGGYEFAKKYYENMYEFACREYGEDKIISAVMHADEINKAATEKYGHPVYHYHMHVVAVPTVKKEILYSKRCKDESLRGTVKETITQISHSKHWKSEEPLLGENGEPVRTKKGKIKYRKSYSVLQDRLYEFVLEKSYTDVQRGEPGSTREHLSVNEYKARQDIIRIAELEKKIRSLEGIEESFHRAEWKSADLNEVGKKIPFTDKITMQNDDYEDLVALARQGIVSVPQTEKLEHEIEKKDEQISILESKVSGLSHVIDWWKNEVARILKDYYVLESKFEEFKESCKDYLEQAARFPTKVKTFLMKLKRERTPEEIANTGNHETAELEKLKAEASAERERKAKEKAEEAIREMKKKAPRYRDDDWCR